MRLKRPYNRWIPPAKAPKLPPKESRKKAEIRLKRGPPRAMRPSDRGVRGWCGRRRIPAPEAAREGRGRPHKTKKKRDF